MKLQVNNSAHQ